MNVVHLSFSDLKGGGARSACRLHRALLSRGMSSRMVVQEKLFVDPSVEEVELSGWQSEPSS